MNALVIEDLPLATALAVQCALDDGARLLPSLGIVTRARVILGDVAEQYDAALQSCGFVRYEAARVGYVLGAKDIHIVLALDGRANGAGTLDDPVLASATVVIDYLEIYKPFAFSRASVSVRFRQPEECVSLAFSVNLP